jgi:GNAT superfamily N-acetyltransferase
MPPDIRPFRSTDIEALRRLVAEMQDYERAIDGRLLEGSEMTQGYTEAMQARCAEHAGLILVADLGGEVVGFTAVQAEVPSQDLDQPPDSYALVSDLAVAAGHRGQGLGRALLVAAEEYARKRGAQELRIAVLAGNHVADQLYQSVGFSPYLCVLSKRVATASEAG